MNSTQHRTWPAPAPSIPNDDPLRSWLEERMGERCLRTYAIGPGLVRVCAMELANVIAIADAYDEATASLSIATQLAARELARVEAVG